MASRGQVLPDFTASHPRPRRNALALLGLTLAGRGVLAKASIAIGGLTTLGAVGAAFVLARTGPHAPLQDLPGVTVSALAWGAGIMLAFAAAAQAFRRDRNEGVRALIAFRGGNRTSYVWARVFGLALLLVLVIGGGTLIAGTVTVLLAARGGLALDAVQSTLASLMYGVAFSLTLAPIALAAVGSRSRSGGYVWLLIVLILPEAFERWTAGMLPYAWRELVSIPAALGALRAALMPPGVDAARFARAVVMLAIVCAVALLAVLREITYLDTQEPS